MKLPDSGKNALKERETRHHQLLTDLAKKLKLKVPAAMMVAFDDHPVPPPNPAFAQVMPGNGNPIATRPGTGGSLRDRIQEKKNASKPGAKNSTGSSLRDRMKARRGNN